MEQTHQPTIMRRQSLPEGFLSQNKAFQVSGLPDLENTMEQKAFKPQHTAETTEQHFKHSQTQRFGRHTKRKSQSLYESTGLQQNMQKQGDQQTYSPELLPVLTRVHSSPPGSAMFAAPALLKQEKSVEEGDEELDFLIPQQPYTSSTSTNATEDKDGAIHAVPYTDDLNGPETYAFSSNYEGFGAPKDDFYHNIHQNFTPAGGNQQMPFYDGPIHFTPYPQQLNTYPLNPLNNFTLHDHAGVLRSQPVSGPAEALSMNFHHPEKFNGEYKTGDLEYKKNDTKRRRSRIPSSPYRGVSRCGKDNKFQARIRVQGKVKYLGRFKSEIEAAKCYDKHAVQYLGVNAQTNFPLPIPTATPMPSSFENKEKF